MKSLDFSPAFARLDLLTNGVVLTKMTVNSERIFASTKGQCYQTVMFQSVPYVFVRFHTFRFFDGAWTAYIRFIPYSSHPFVMLASTQAICQFFISFFDRKPWRGILSCVVEGIFETPIGGLKAVYEECTISTEHCPPPIYILGEP